LPSKSFGAESQGGILPLEQNDHRFLKIGICSSWM